MAKNRTNKSKYTSPSTGEFCTPAQYVAELMCQRQAEKKNEGALPHKFWNNSKWKSQYIHQIKLAHELIEEFNDRAVVRAIQTGFGQKIFSLRHPKIKELVEQEAKRLESEKPKQQVLDFSETDSKPVKPYRKKKKNWRALD